MYKYNELKRLTKHQQLTPIELSNQKATDKSELLSNQKPTDKTTDKVRPGQSNVLLVPQPMTVPLLYSSLAK